MELRAPALYVLPVPEVCLQSSAVVISMLLVKMLSLILSLPKGLVSYGALVSMNVSMLSAKKLFPLLPLEDVQRAATSHGVRDF